MTVYYCDGSGWNGERAGFAVVNNDTGTVSKKTFREKTTNNEAEYLAVIHALSLCANGDVVFTDSQLVVNQCKREEIGRWKVNEPRLRELQGLVLAALAEKPDVELLWVARSENVAGIVMENEKKRA